MFIGQIRTVRAVVGNVFTVLELLRDIERLLRGQFVPAVHIHLEAQQVKRQRCGRGFSPVGGGREHAGRFSGQSPRESFPPGLIRQPLFIVHRRVFGRLPAGADNVRTADKLPCELVVKRLAVRLIVAPPAHNHSQHRRLDAANRNRALIALIAGFEGVTAAHTEAKNRVSCAAHQGFQVHPTKIAVIAQGVDGFFHRWRGVVVNKRPFHRRGVSGELQHLVNQELPLVVRVAAVDNHFDIRAPNQLHQGISLLCHARFWLKLYRVQLQRQGVERPGGVGRVDRLRGHHFQHVADAVAHDIGRRFGIAVVPGEVAAQRFRDIARDCGFFCNPQSHS
ncbi:Uncharacterised protein [Escherichia coli]|nr:Uncharacterised protein [Escherichia coli]